MKNTVSGSQPGALCVCREHGEHRYVTHTACGAEPWQQNKAAIAEKNCMLYLLRLNLDGGEIRDSR